MEYGNEDSNVPLVQEVTKYGEKATSPQTLVNVLISILGTGVLSIPYAFRVTGWLSASIGLLISCCAAYYCMLLLVDCRGKIEEDAEDTNTLALTKTYGDIGANAFGAQARFITELLIVMAHSGCAVAFLVFIGQNLSFLFINSSSLSSSTSIIFLLLPLELVLSFITSLSFLSKFSAFATVCNLFAMAIVIKENIIKIKEVDISNAYENIVAVNGLWSIPFACGIAVFCFQGFGMTLTLHGSMMKPKKFSLVLMQAFVGLLLAYVCFGFFGYMAYGNETMGIITLNLPNNWSAILVKIGLCIAIMFTLPLILIPVYDIIETTVRSSKTFERFLGNLEYKCCIASKGIRLIVVVVLAVIATVAPGFAQLVSVTGNTICALISFVLPTVYHLKIMGPSLCLWRRVVDCVILMAGSALALHGIFSAVQSVVG